MEDTEQVNKEELWAIMSQPVNQQVHGYHVSFTKEQADLIIERSELRKQERREIKVNGIWYKICRTDLKDDVCTSSCGNGSTDEEVREMMAASNRYGVRLYNLEHGNLFAVIDAYSDG